MYVRETQEGHRDARKLEKTEVSLVQLTNYRKLGNPTPLLVFLPRAGIASNGSPTAVPGPAPGSASSSYMN